jgi:hypothetical protein
MPSFTDDAWSNLGDGYPNDWLPAPPADSGVDDWFDPGDWIAASPPSPDAQPFGAPQANLSRLQGGTVPGWAPSDIWNDPGSSPVFNQPPPKPNPLAAYWPLTSASGIGALAWPPTSSAFFGKPPQPTPYELPPGLGDGGILGGIPKMLAAQKAAANDPWAAARDSIVGGFADPPLAADGLPINFGQGGILGALRYLQPSTTVSQATPGFAGNPQPNAGNHQSLDPNSLVRLVADHSEEEQRKKEERQLETFDQRAFGTGHRLGSTAPFIIPPPGRTNAPPSPPQAAPQALQAPPPSLRAAPAAPNVPAEAVSSLASVGAPRPAPAAVPNAPATRLNLFGEETPEPAAPSVKFGQPASLGPKWLPPTGGIRKALAEGSGLQQAIRAALPEYDQDTTYGVLITNEGDVVPLKDGGTSTFYSNYTPAGHVEGKAAIWIREHNSTGGVVYHNNTDGTCGFCNSMLTTLLPYKTPLRVVPPSNAVAKDAWDIDYPKEYVGNAAILKPPRQRDLFGNQP